MKYLDLSPYLIDIFTHSETAAQWQANPEKLDACLQSIEQWWERQNAPDGFLRTGVAYMMLSYLNLLSAHIAYLDIEADWKDVSHRIFKIRVEIIEHFGSANFIWEEERIINEVRKRGEV